jgi:hypothetical protein
MLLLAVGGDAQVLAYIGHNGLVDFSLAGRSSGGAAGTTRLCCVSYQAGLSCIE